MNLIPVEYQRERILTTEQLAQVYGTEVKIISNNFNRNPKKFIEGKHYHRLEGEELRSFKGIHQNDESLKFVSKLYLWTKRGASRHCKMLGTDKAWEQFDILEESYFTQKPMSQLEVVVVSANALLEQEKRLKQVELIQSDQAEELKEIKAQIETHPKDYYSIAGYASLRGVCLDISKANLLGRMASKLSRNYEMHIGKISDPRFGKINSYHLDILKEIFKGEIQ